MARRPIATFVVLAVLAIGACSGTDGASGRVWTSLPIATTFGRNVTARPIAYARHRYVAIGTRDVTARDRSGRARAPTMWTSRDGTSWSRLRTFGLPRRAGCGTCTITWLTTWRGHQVLSLDTVSGVRLYASNDLVHWDGVLSVARPNVDELAATHNGFLASFVHRHPDGASTYEGYTSGDGVAWTRIPRVAPPAVSGLPAGAQLRDRYFSVDRSDPNAERMMFSRDRRVWVPVAGPTPRHLELQLVASARNDFLGGEYYDMARQQAAKGVFVTSRDTVHWTEVRSFHRRFPGADLSTVARLGDWWLVTGAIGEVDGRLRPWPIWASRDLKHWLEEPSAIRTRKSGEVRIHVVHDLAFGISDLGTAPIVVFRPPV